MLLRKLSILISRVRLDSGATANGLAVFELPILVCKGRLCLSNDVGEACLKRLSNTNFV